MVDDIAPQTLPACIADQTEWYSGRIKAYLENILCVYPWHIVAPNMHKDDIGNILLPFLVFLPDEGPAGHYLEHKSALTLIA